MKKIEVRSKFNFKYSLYIQAVITLSFLTFAYSAFAQECSDPDGDGFGWNGTKSCEVNKCYQADRLNGWGWDQFGNDCKISVNCRDDFNGDDWGYDSVNDISCKLSKEQIAAQTNPTGGSCEDTGRTDGWGWNETTKESCRLSTNTCVDTPPYGNGWGWNGTSSCKLDGSAPTTPTTSSGTVNEFSSHGTSNTDAVPHWLFNRQDCQKTKWSQKLNKMVIDHTWAEIPYRDYIVQHNIWNDGAMDVNGVNNRTRISLCTQLTGSTTNPTPSWTYDFLGEYDGSPTDVKAYPQVFYGRKFGAFNDSGTVSDLGVPVRINQMDKFEVEYKYSENNVGERNVALESFFHPQCDYKENTRLQQYEMMVWVGRPTKRTGGTTKVGEATIDGAQWEVYLNTNLPWRYIAYVRKSTSKEDKLNWNKFVEYTKNEAYKLDSRVPKLNPDECMNGIEMGTEIFFGKGDFKLDRFNVIRYKRNK